MSSVTIPRALRDSVTVAEIVKSFGMCFSDVAFVLRHSACACNGGETVGLKKGKNSGFEEEVMDDLINRVQTIEVKETPKRRTRTIQSRYSVDTHDGASM